MVTETQIFNLQKAAYEEKMQHHEKMRRCDDLHREVLYQKYKRCLDKAKRCEAEINYADSIGYAGAIRFYVRLQEKYLELAEKFKEAMR